MSHRLPIFTLPVLAIILLASGCSTLPQGDSDLVQTQQLPPNQPMILVEMQSEKQGGSSVKLPLATAPTIQAAIDQAHVPKKFHRFHVAISRLPQHPGAAPQKLIAKYDHLAKRVPFEYDYQLQAGDRVVVVESSTTAFDEIFGGVLDPLRAMSGYGTKDKSPF